jgi:plasmid stabilization system protein ParE
VVVLTPEAEAHLKGLILHYESLDRPAATRNMMTAVEAAKERIARAPAAGLPAPRPYPQLKKLGRLWLKEGPLLDFVQPHKPPGDNRGVF